MCVFLPVIFILYCIIPFISVQNVLLVIASLLFYTYGEQKYVLLMICSALVNYVFALLVDHAGSKGKKWWLAADVVINLGLLGLFKYTDMVIQTVNNIAGSSIALKNITLPLGISFFTFQAMSYVIDVYRGVNKSEKNPLKVLLYISFFPQLIAGPIVKYHDIEEYLSHRTKSPENMAKGFRRFCYGLAKKVMISNAMAVAVDAIYEMTEINAPLAWLAAAAYMLQIYFDFSGYSDMAIGMGHMFGFTFPENFNYPYISGSIKEFWRRWHISLSTWFKEYLYIPLGGNRKGSVRTAINKIIVFFCTGLWHGANWTFVIWGLYHGFFLLLEQYIHLPKNKVLGFFKHIYALLVVCIGFVIFRADTITQAGHMIAAMFTDFHTNTNLNAQLLQVTDIKFIVMFIIGIIAATPVKGLVEKLVTGRQTNAANVNLTHEDNDRKGKAQGAAANIIMGCSYVIAMVLLVLCMLSLAGNGYNPFIYFRF
jgi:alginate O-acetyltransferase complex protein AlgI